MPRPWLQYCALLALGACLARTAAADEIPDLADELPRIAPVEAAAAIDTFQVADGFRLEQVAAEPLVHDPVAISFDERGRLYVVEMCDYSEQDRDFLGVVRLLEDTTGDGRFDRSSKFAEDFSWPTAVICYDGGVFVGAAPDIWYLKDTTGDGQADLRRKVFTGFARTNVQGLLNTFLWGLDNRIYAATSSSGGEVRRADDDSEPTVSLRGRDFAFDPRTLELTAESGGAQHGMSFDDWGRRFVCSNSDHIQMVMFDDRYIARNPLQAAPSPRLSIASDGPQAEVYRISPVEPWRIVRTRLRMSGAVPGMVEGGGRAAGYFTGATGTTIYRGDAWPEGFRGNAFVGDVGSNIVHRKLLEADGVGFVAHRAEEEREFVASRDIWFRPAQFANGPDGNLYIVDVYREVIEHPDSLPPVIKKHLDLTSGRDRGRIYRLAAGAPRSASPGLADTSTGELVVALEHPNSWHRETAAWLLFERQDRAAVADLKRLAAEGATPLGRLHALYALQGLDALSAETVRARLSDEHPGVREHAVRLSEPFLQGDTALADAFHGMTDDADARVRYQLAFSLGGLPPLQRAAPLVELAARDGNDRWVAVAIQSSLSEGAADFVTRVLQHPAAENAQPVLQNVALQLGRAANEEDLVRVLTTLSDRSFEPREQAVSVLQNIARGMTAARFQRLLAERQLTLVAGHIDKLVNGAMQVAFDRQQPVAARLQALQMLELSPRDDAVLELSELLDPRQPAPLQEAAIERIARLSGTAVVAALLERWPGMAPKTRGQAAEILLSRADRIPLVLDALDQGQLSSRDFDVARLKQLASHRDPVIQQRAAALLANATPAERAQVLDQYQQALSLSGDAGAGKQVFAKVCASCHKVESVGHEIGPNLATVQNRGAEAILTNVIDPNREVNPQYVNYLLVTDDGRTLSGMIGSETATSMTLVRADNQSDTVLRSEIESLESTGVSLMPEGLEKDISPQAMADLIAYLLSLN